MDILNGKSIVLGVTGGIAAFKAAALASHLVRAGSNVTVIMTESAREFMQPLTFSAITHNDVHTTAFTPWRGDFCGHVSLASEADLLIVAPATAKSIAGLALGLADNLLQLVAISTTAPILIAPAMEEHMLLHPATRLHLETLAARGAAIVGPDRGRLASGASGAGRMAEPEIIVDAARWLLGRSGPLQGRRIVVSAGGTREPLDPVRYLGNRSSGTMGYAIAREALAAGADVVLVSGPVNMPPPYGAEFIGVETAIEMRDAVESATEDADALIMAAAVADFRPETRQEQKIKKAPEQTHLELKLLRNPDILASIDRPGMVRIGFAAETDDLLANAQKKLVNKRLDAIIANDAEATIGSPTSRATILTSSGDVRSLPEMPKDDLAAAIISLTRELIDTRALEST
ncbi:MAG: bifunctional phosphopantothenoylcysteine decarboxylase/phosphopantothenate--cysteine ligase CoaBC [Thermomicrobiales bacterium]